MTAVFISQNVWAQLTAAVCRSRQKCAVAVAYFGAGAERLLPLRKGSHLVVDASERAVASGQTCPTDLLTLVERGVVAYSVPNLHAKVFVLGRTAYIGSTNVSNRSAAHLVEAVIRTTEPGAVQAARQFVEDCCLHELTPEKLKQLAKLYRPPRIPGGKRKQKPVNDTSNVPTPPRLLLAQQELEKWSRSDQELHDSGMKVAKKRRKQPRRFELDSFRWRGKCPYLKGDVVVQVTDEGGGRTFVAPPGNVLHVRKRGGGAKQVSFVYLELPVRRRRRIGQMARILGCPQKRLRRNGLVQSQSFARALLNSWAVHS